MTRYILDTDHLSLYERSHPQVSAYPTGSSTTRHHFANLRIASITIAEQGIPITRNRRDFEKVPGLIIEDWSI